MSDRDPVLDEATLKFGLLMESAQAHQKLAETHLDRLQMHTQDLDGVVRDEIRRTLTSELHALSAETQRATEVFRSIRGGAAGRSALWSVMVAILCTAVPTLLVRWMLPSESEIAALRARRDQLAAAVAVLETRGGRIDWRHCGATPRLCVRVDRRAPVYGETADYYVVAGY